MSPTTIALLVAAGLVTVVVVLSMLRQPALRRIGLRNFSRRKWNTALVVLGSMVGTALISGSLVLNDSTARFQYDQARSSLGEIDEVVQQTSQRLPSDRRLVPNFDASKTANVTPQKIEAKSKNAKNGPGEVDGILGVLTQEVPAETVGKNGKTKLASPAVTVIGTDWKDLKKFGSSPPPPASRPAPGPDQVYISKSMSGALEAKAGDKIKLRGIQGLKEFEVVAVLPETGISGYKAQFSSSDGTALVSMKTARSLFGAGGGEINTLFVSNKGNDVAGVGASGAVTTGLQKLLKGKGDASFEISQVKKDTIEQGGFQIGDIFLMISSFAILAGILLIVNIYTMLAEERKGELGILRAVALKRGGLIRTFVYEGYAYSLLASLLGVFVGLGIAYALVLGINQAATAFAGLFGSDLVIPFYVRPVSLLVSLASGLLITFLAVFFTSLRISNLNIVSAIRDLPEEKPVRRPIGRILIQAIVLLVGLAISAAAFFPDVFSLGLSTANRGYLMLVGPVLAAGGLGFLLGRILQSRPLWTVISGAVLAYAYLANNLDPVSKANEASPAVFFVEGVFMVLAAVLIVAFNLGILYAALRLLMRLVPRLAPVLRIAVAYPAAKRSRTGFTLAMFALVMYVVTVSSVFASTQNASSARTKGQQLSGYDGFVQTGPIASIKNFDKKLKSNKVLKRDTYAPTKISALGVTLPKYKADKYKTDRGPSSGIVLPGAGISEYLTLVPNSFSNTTTDELAVRSQKYPTDRAAWRALEKDPNLVILTYPYDGKGNFQARPKLGPGDKITLENPKTGKKIEKTVIGRLKDPGGFNLGVVNGIIAGEKARSQFDGLRAQSTYLFRTKPGANLTAVGRELNREFATTGAQSYLVQDILGRGQAFIGAFVKIVQAFLAFGLLVGVAGLAVISARAVHERYREIGTMRAIGFKKGTVGWQFIVESSFVALIGVVIGISVGALGGYNLFNFTVTDSSAVFVFPWVQMILIGTGVWIASLLSTIVPAIRASRVPPVEALRYEG